MSPTYAALGFDPAPGDVSSGTGMARTMRDVTHALGEIRAVVRGDSEQDWKGRAADAFRDLMSEDFSPRIDEAYESFSVASRALDRWVLDLDVFQARAAALEREAEAARERVQSASAALSGMGEAPSGGGDQRQEYDDRRSGLQTSLSSHQGELDDILARARALADEASTSAETTAGALDTAMRAAPDEPGLWDKLTDIVADIGEFLGDVLEFVRDNWWDILHKLVAVAALVLAVAALLVPGVGWLAGAALIAAIVDTSMSGIDWARGEPGAQEAFLTGLVGLGAGAIFGAVVKAATPAMNAALRAGPFSVVASGGAGSIAVPTVAALSVNGQYGSALAGFMLLRMKDSRDASEGITSLLGGNTYYDDDLAEGWRRARDN